MIISKIAPDDVAVCVNYVTDEYESITGSSSGARGLAIRFERDIKSKDGIKIVIDGKIVGFCIYEDFDGKMLLTSFYISKDKRYGRCIYEMFKHCINIAGDKEIIYIPLHKDMTLPERICRNGIIKKYAVKEWLEKVENKYK